MATGLSTSLRITGPFVPLEAQLGGTCRYGHSFVQQTYTQSRHGPRPGLGLGVQLLAVPTDITCMDKRHKHTTSCDSEAGRRHSHGTGLDGGLLLLGPACSLPACGTGSTPAMTFGLLGCKVKMLRPWLKMSQELWNLSETVSAILSETETVSLWLLIQELTSGQVSSSAVG